MTVSSLQRQDDWQRWSELLFIFSLLQMEKSRTRTLITVSRQDQDALTRQLLCPWFSRSWCPSLQLLCWTTRGRAPPLACVIMAWESLSSPGLVLAKSLKHCKERRAVWFTSGWNWVGWGEPRCTGASCKRTWLQLTATSCHPAPPYTITTWVTSHKSVSYSLPVI